MGATINIEINNNRTNTSEWTAGEASRGWGVGVGGGGSCSDEIFCSDEVSMKKATEPSERTAGKARGGGGCRFNILFTAGIQTNIFSPGASWAPNIK